MRSLFALAVLVVLGLAMAVGCAPVPGGPALSNTTASGDASLVSAGTTAGASQVSPQVTSAAE